MTTHTIAEPFGMDDLQYAVVLELCAPEEGAGYAVTVPALPEIVTQGDTLEHALAMAKEAIELTLSVRRDEGMPIPPSDAGTARLEIVTVTLPAA